MILVFERVIEIVYFWMSLFRMFFKKIKIKYYGFCFFDFKIIIICLNKIRSFINIVRYFVFFRFFKFRIRGRKCF